MGETGAVSWEKERIIVKVPKNAKSGKMYVQSGRKHSNWVEFTVEMTRPAIRVPVRKMENR